MGTFNRRFGKQLKLLRTRANMTREEFAERLNVTAISLGKIESGLVDTRLDTLERIAAVLNVSYKVLLDV